MAEDTHLTETFQLAQELDASLGVEHEVVAGGSSHLTCGTTYASVVVAQRGNAVTCQMVGNNGKRLVVEERLVAVLLSAASHHQHHGDALTVLIVHRVAECSGQYGTVLCVLEGHLLGGVRVGRLWRLRTVALQFTPAHV